MAADEPPNGARAAAAALESGIEVRETADRAERVAAVVVQRGLTTQVFPLRVLAGFPDARQRKLSQWGVDVGGEGETGMVAVGTRALPSKVALLEVRTGKQTVADQPFFKELRADPAVLIRHVGLVPDPWQEDVLRCGPSQTLLLCSRQAGKSTVSAPLTQCMALLRLLSPVLLLSPLPRQSGELFRKVLICLGRWAGRRAWPLRAPCGWSSPTEAA